MNTLASRLQNQLSRWEEGKSNLTAATRRGDCFFLSVAEKQAHRPSASGFTGEKEAKGEKGKASGLQQLDRKSPAGQVSPISSHLHPLLLSLSIHSLSTPLPAHPDTTYQSPCDTGDYIPPSSPPDETEQ